MKRIVVVKTLAGLAACLLVGASLANCTPGPSTVGGTGGRVGSGAVAAGGAGGTAGATTESVIVLKQDGAVYIPEDASTDDAVVNVWPPAGFVNVTDSTVGSYALGPQISPTDDAGAPGGDGTPTPPTQCAALFGVVRDFKLGSNPPGQPVGHPDFETAPVGADLGIVAATLGTDGKPVYADKNGTGRTLSTTGKANFDQWYNNVPDVNMAFVLALRLVNVNGIATFQATKPNYFFPLDNQGFGNEGQPHNFAFTTEIHTAFTYNGGETFAFSGDDDVWVFINNQLVIDMGGRHAQQTKTIALDTLGLTKGTNYEIAIFHAERHSDASNFQVNTTLSFSNCGQVEGVIK